MTKIVFETKGLIDIKSFTTFGINVKPNTESPIGYFGTGLKYAIAILTREGADRVTVFIGTTEYEFYCKSQSFRGRNFDFIKMRKRKSLIGRWSYQELSFTTEFGKNWDMWQAFRELESNTRDEKGSTYTEEGKVVGEEGVTKIVVDNEEFTEVFHDRDQIFLPTENIVLVDESDYMEVYLGQSSYIYYRGLRVQQLSRPSIYTYNILSPTDLTEDRTLKYYHWEVGEITRSIINSQDKDFIASVVEADPEENFEGSLHFDTSSSQKSSIFMEVVKSKIIAGAALLPRVKTLYISEHPELGEDDPLVEVLLKKSEWGFIKDLLCRLDLASLSEEEEFDSIVELRDKLAMMEYR